MGFIWTIEVGWTTQRPIVPDEHFTRVVVSAATADEATLIAAQMVAARGATMVTRSEVV